MGLNIDNLIISYATGFDVKAYDSMGNRLDSYGNIIPGLSKYNDDEQESLPRKDAWRIVLREDGTFYTEFLKR